MPNLNVRLNKNDDSDIIKFWEKQLNKSLSLKVITRILIKKFGYEDIIKCIAVEDIKI